MAPRQALLLLPVLVGAGFLAARLSPPALLDGGFAPQPYRYLNPPPGAATTQPPLAGTGQVHIGPAGSDANSIFTDDVQVSLAILPGVFPAVAGQDAVSITITPIPTPVPAPPGVTFIGNAYRVTAVYSPSGQPVATPFAKEALVELRYALHAPNQVELLDGERWSAVSGTVTPATQQISARVTRFGVFVAAAGPGLGQTPASVPASPPPGQSHPGSGGPPIGLLVGTALLLVVGATGLAVLARRSRDPSP